jgi:hypothetical protein
MSTAQKLFIIYGILIAAYGLLLGIPLASTRMKSPTASRHLVNAHLSALMQSSLHFGLAFAVGMVGFESTLASVGAGLLVAGTALESAGGTTNWLTSTNDQFAENSLGYKFNSLSGPLAIIGILILTFGILTNI